MKKSDELTNPNSCMSRARPDEMTFVLLERDICGPDTIRFWATKRLAMGKNNPEDPQILEALACAEYMERKQAERRASPEETTQPSQETK